MCRHISRYDKLINHYRKTITEGYVEKHHIIPKCMGGDDSLSNLVALPPRAHYIAHYLLWKAYPNNKSLAHAYAMMAVNNPYQYRIMNSKLYELAKTARSSVLKGVPRSEEVKIKMRKPKSTNANYFGNTNAKGNKGKKHPPRSADHIQKLSESLKCYHKKLKEQNNKKIQRYRSEFLASNMSRKEFANKYNISYSTVKRYLRGL